MAALWINLTGGQPAILPVGPLEGENGLAQTDQQQYMDRSELLSFPLNFSLTAANGQLVKIADPQHRAPTSLNSRHHQAEATSMSDKASFSPLRKLQVDKMLRVAVRTVARAPN